MEALGAADFWSALHQVQPTPATINQIHYVHTKEYVSQLRQHCEQSIPLGADTPVVPASFDVALLAVGGVLGCADAVISGAVGNAFALVRPPGHHAGPGYGMGFCLFNNVAIAARYLQRNHGVDRVAIVDWDVHHGNGTQDVFYEDPSVFYFSIHQSPLYPGTGLAHERGAGKGVGTTLNAPMAPGSESGDYIELFKKTLKPALLDFSPDFILISAGFDAHQLDPLATIEVTAEGFALLTDIVAEIAAESCEGRIVSALEGGYSLKGLSGSVAAHVERLVKYA